MQRIASLSMACIMWIFPFFAMPHTFVAEQPFKFQPLGSIKPVNNESFDDEYCSQDWHFKNPRDQKAYNYLNLQIQNLTNLRNYYDAKIARLRDKADYYQFQRGQYPLDSQAFLNRIDNYQKIVDRIDNEIAILKEQRRELLQRQKPSP